MIIKEIKRPSSVTSSSLAMADDIKKFDCLEGWALSYISTINGLMSGVSESDVENLDLIHKGIFNASKYYKAVKTMAIGDKMSPVQIKHYDILAPKLSVLIGEESLADFDYTVVNKSPRIADSYQRQKDKLIEEFHEQVFKIAALKQAKENESKSGQKSHVQYDPTELNDLEKPCVKTVDGKKLYSIKDINTYLETSADITEVQAAALLGSLVASTEFKDKYVFGIKNILACNKEVYHVDMVGEEPNIRPVNIKNLYYNLAESENDISRSPVIKEIVPMTVSDIVRMYSEYLSEDDVEYILKMSNINMSIDVNLYEFAVLRKIGILSYFNELGILVKKIVDDSYKTDKKLGETVKTRIIEERYEAAVINNCCVFKVQKLSELYTNLDSLRHTNSRYRGYIGTYSIADIVKHYLFLYDINMYALEVAYFRAKGAGITVDIAQMPVGDEWSMEAWMHFLNNGVHVIDSSRRDEQGQRSNFNQFSTYDLNLTAAVKYKFEAVALLDEIISKLINISNQRLGTVENRETYRGVERSVKQSNIATVHLVIPHAICKRRVLQHLLNMAKCSDVKDHYATVFSGIKSIVKVSPRNLKLEDLHVFVSNENKDKEKLEGLKANADAIYQKGLMELQYYLEIMATNSYYEAKRLTIDSDDKNRERGEEEMKQKQTEMEQNRQVALQQLEDAKELKYAEIDAGKYKTDQNRLAMIESATINNLGKLAVGMQEIDADLNHNGVPDFLEQVTMSLNERKLRLEEKKHEDNVKLKQQQLAKSN